jgi:hypothetical protein
MLNLVNKLDNNLFYGIKQLSPSNISRSNKNYLFAFVANHLIYYPTPISLTYAWSFGFLAGMRLLTQMMPGIFLAMHYTPHVDLTFSSVEYIMRDVSNGSFFGMFSTNLTYSEISDKLKINLKSGLISAQVRFVVTDSKESTKNINPKNIEKVLTNEDTTVTFGKPLVEIKKDDIQCLSGIGEHLEKSGGSTGIQNLADLPLPNLSHLIKKFDD